MNSRHILNAVLFGLGFSGILWFALFYGTWFIPSAIMAAMAGVAAVAISVYFSLYLIPSKRTAIGAYALANSWAVKLGRTVFYSFILWLPLAQSVPAAFTDIFGKPATAHETVIHFYRSTLTCGQRLVLASLNPPFGGYCRAAPPQAFSTGQPIILKYKESVLGISVLAFSPAKG